MEPLPSKFPQFRKIKNEELLWRVRYLFKFSQTIPPPPLKNIQTKFIITIFIPFPLLAPSLPPSKQTKSLTLSLSNSVAHAHVVQVDLVSYREQNDLPSSGVVSYAVNTVQRLDELVE